MSNGKKVGDLIVRGGKYIIEHHEEVESVVTAATRIVHTVMELKEKLLNPQTKAEYFIQLEEANNILHDKIMEMESKIYQLAEYYDNEFVALEKKNESLTAEIESLKLELEAHKTETSVYKKKIQKILLLTGILMSVSVIVALVLAVVI